MRSISLKPRERTAFTLVELLVVIGIISILAVILMAGSQGFTTSQRQVKCSNNLRQIGLAIAQYASDHDQSIPIRNNADWIKPEPDGIWTYLYGDSDIWAHWPKFSGTVYRCPTLEAKNDPGTSYGMNSIIGGNFKEPIKLSKIVHRSQTMIVLESHGIIVQPPGGENGPMNLEPRHGKNINILYLDGHVEAMPFDSVPLDPESPFWSING